MPSKQENAQQLAISVFEALGQTDTDVKFMELAKTDPSTVDIKHFKNQLMESDIIHKLFAPKKANFDDISLDEVFRKLSFQYARSIAANAAHHQDLREKAIHHAEILRYSLLDSLDRFEREGQITPPELELRDTLAPLPSKLLGYAREQNLDNKKASNVLDHLATAVNSAGQYLAQARQHAQQQEIGDPIIHQQLEDFLQTLARDLSLPLAPPQEEIERGPEELQDDDDEAPPPEEVHSLQPVVPDVREEMQRPREELADGHNEEGEALVVRAKDLPVDEEPDDDLEIIANPPENRAAFVANPQLDMAPRHDRDRNQGRDAPEADPNEHAQPENLDNAIQRRVLKDSKKVKIYSEQKSPKGMTPADWATFQDRVKAKLDKLTHAAVRESLKEGSQYNLEQQKIHDQDKMKLYGEPQWAMEKISANKISVKSEERDLQVDIIRNPNGGMRTEIPIPPDDLELLISLEMELERARISGNFKINIEVPSSSKRDLETGVKMHRMAKALKFDVSFKDPSILNKIKEHSELQRDFDTPYLLPGQQNNRPQANRLE